MARDLWSFMQTLQVICGVIVVQTSSRWETAAWLDGVSRWWGKAWEKHKSHLQFVERRECASLVRPNLVTRVASQFDGVGWDKARSLGKRFGSLGEFMSADAEELRKVKGIGPKIANGIVKQREESWETNWTQQ
jgi:ERCC4-type nuclease